MNEGELPGATGPQQQEHQIELRVVGGVDEELARLMNLAQRCRAMVNTTADARVAETLLEIAKDYERQIAEIGANK